MILEEERFMGTYTLTQWVLFFYFYCFCGWVWESCYVSARQRHWVNRGFLHGPLLPIYGSGAIIILVATIRVQDSLGLIYLFGMLAATILEYITGYVMERLFRVRYWDYSNQKLNLSGYICLSSSLAWGVFSILLVRLIHPPIARLICLLPRIVSEAAAYLLVASSSMDAIQSFRAALDLRDLLIRLTEENEELRRLAKRAEVVSAFAEEDLRRFREKTDLNRSLLTAELEERRERREEQKLSRSQLRQARAEDALRRRSEAKLQALHTIDEALENYRTRLESSKELTQEALRQRKTEISELLEKLHSREASIRSRTIKSYRQSMRILRGNPSASASGLSEALENLRRLSERK